MPAPRTLSAVTFVTAALGLALMIPASAQALAPAVDTAAGPKGEPWVVSLGDSYISGEAGRWAGNQSLGTGKIDALGGAAYWDAGSGEAIERCHRSTSAAIHIGVVRSLNLACSGAVTQTKTTSEGYFKPGIDFYDDGSRKGQALMLQEFAAEHNVKMVALSISGNDFKFAPIFEACVKAYLVPFATPHCKDDPTVQGYLSESAQQRVRGDTANAILNVATAMENAGYEDSEWTLVLQLYPQPLPASSQMRYPESGYSRQVDGGCGLRNGDLDWAVGSVLPMINTTYRGAASDAQGQRPTLQVAVLDSSRAFSGRELCNESVSRVGSTGGVTNWKDQGSVDRSEWVQDINILNPGDTYAQESLHPNYWGQMALRNCYRQIWNGGNVRGGACERVAGGGLTADCEPAMTLVPEVGSVTRAAVTPGQPDRGGSADAPGQPDRGGSADPPGRTGVKVSLRCPGITVKAGGTAVLKGRVTPAGADVTVAYQARRDGGTWRTKATTTPGPRGGYRFAFTVPRSAPMGRTYEWRVIVKAEGMRVATSQTRSAVVR